MESLEGIYPPTLQASLDHLTSVRPDVSGYRQLTQAPSQSWLAHLLSCSPIHSVQGSLLSVTLIKEQLPPVFGYSLFSCVASDIHPVLLSFNLSQVEEPYVQLLAGLSPKRHCFFYYLLDHYFKILTMNFIIRELSLGPRELTQQLRAQLLLQRTQV